jgi:tetratricopeptide (TPR) repeat protein
MIAQLEGRLNHLQQVNGKFQNQNHLALAKLSKKLYERVQGYPYHMVMGDTHFAMKQLNQAEVEYSRAYKMKPKEPEVLLKLGNVLVQSKKYDRALMAFQEGINLNQKDVRFHMAAVKPLLETKKEDKALQAALNATRLSPGAGEAHFFHGMVLHRQKKWTEAQKSLQLALKLKPSLKEARQLLDSIKKTLDSNSKP